MPLVTQHYPAKLAAPIGARGGGGRRDLAAARRAWDAAVTRATLAYRDAQGRARLPLPRLAGAHQAMNAALAVAMLRHQQALDIPESALRAAMGWAEWPARLQLLSPGPLRDLLPPGAELWLDGAHNPAGVARGGRSFPRPADRPFHLIFGLLANKDAPGVLHPFRGRVDDRSHHPRPGSRASCAGRARRAPRARAGIAR